MREELVFYSMNGNKLIFDVETTGLDAENNYISQLSYIIVGSEGQIAKNFFFTVPKMEKGAEDTHKLSMSKLEMLSQGKTFKECAAEILMDFKNCDLCIGHNINFDLKFIKKEFERINIKINYLQEKVYCTMHEYTDILKLKNTRYKGYKWPKLEEVVNYLNMDEEKLLNLTRKIYDISNYDDFNGYHDSRFDVICTEKIYFAKECNEKYVNTNFNDINIVILDIETTGGNYFIDEICQMSYIILNKSLDIIKTRNYFFDVDYVHFKSNKMKLNKENLKYLSNYKSFKDNYDEIFNDLNKNLIVCHNCQHDLNFLRSEFMRANNKNNFKCKEFCTMTHYTEVLKLNSENYKYKYPKLIEVMPYLNIKRGDINSYCKKIFDLSEEEIQFHDSRVDSVSTYLIAIKTPELIKKYKEVINEEIDYMRENDVYYTLLSIDENVQNENKELKIFNDKNQLIIPSINKKGRKKSNKIIAIICLILITYVYLKNEHDDKIIDIVRNYQSDEFNVNEILESTVTYRMTDYGWNVDKVAKDTYFVYYEFDNDDNTDNGTNIISYEYYKLTNEVKVVSGKLAQEYIDLGYLDEDSAMLVNGTQVINTTYYTYNDKELRSEDYTVDRDLAKDNLKINKKLYGDFKNDINNKESSFTGGRAKETVFIAEGDNVFHRDINCSELEGEDVIFRVFHRKVDAENRVFCECER